MHNGRRKFFLSYRSDIKKIDPIEYRRKGNTWKNNQNFQNKSKSCRADEFSKFCKFSMERKAGLAKKRLLRKKFKRHYLSSAQKIASTQTLGSAFLERIRKVQILKYETDLLKIVDCFIDGFGTVKSERINFSINN